MNTIPLFTWFKRETAFFWLGMLLLPVFWVWWTLHPRFKSWERGLAVKWTAAWVAFMVVRRDELPGYFGELAAAFPFWCSVTALALTLWFMVRTEGLSALLWLIVFAPHLSFVMSPGGPELHPVALLAWLLIVVALNFYLEPAARALHRLALRAQRKLSHGLHPL